jgi:phosphopantothenoylcysteine decarboxylase/phosphopantothenate--cysteine ligase
VAVQTAAELQAACRERFPGADVLLMAAAVVDFRPAGPYEGKLKKTGDDDGLHVDFARTPDILAGLAAARRPGQTLVGFAAEHGTGAVGHGREKLARKGVDAVVVNDISRADIGFDATHNEVTIVTAAEETHVARASKAEVARAVLDAVGRLRAEGAAAEPAASDAGAATGPPA